MSDNEKSKFERIEAINKARLQTTKKLKDNMYGVIVIVLSLFVLIVFPLIGSSADGWLFDSYTTSDWIYFIGSKVIISAFNLVIFISLKRQGELNVRNHPKYIEACEILSRNKEEGYKPLSPAVWSKREILHKGTMIILSTLTTLLIFTNIIIKYDWLSLISYSMTVLMALIWGLFEMSNAEIYWTTTFYDYAIMKQKEANNVNKRE